MSTNYSFKNLPNITMKAFSKEYGITSNKLLDYLREEGILNYCNEPIPGFEDWFKKVDYGKGVKRHDLTTKGEEEIRKMIERDGLAKVNNR